MPTLPIAPRLKAGLIILIVVAFVLIVTIIGLVVGSTSKMAWTSSPIFQRAMHSDESATYAVGGMPAPMADYDIAERDMASGLVMPPVYTTPGATPEERKAVGPKIIKTGSVSMRVNDVQQTFVEVGNIAKGFGGYVADGQVNSGDETPSGSLTLRIPSDRYDETVTSIKKLAIVVLGSYVNSEDVTAAFVDVEARLKAAKAEETQYLEILKRANSIEDTLNVTARLGEVRAHIEQMEGHLRSLKDRTDYATLSVNLSQEARIQIPTGVWRPLSTLKSAGQSLVVALQILVDGILVGLVFIVGLLLPIFVILFLIAKIIRWTWMKMTKTKK